MGLITKVKASAVNNLSDGRYFSTFAEWIGFNFNPESPRYVDFNTAKEIIGWLNGPIMVGEFNDQNEDMIVESLKKLPLTAIQTTIDVDKDRLPDTVNTWIKRILINEFVDADRLEALLMTSATEPDFFLLDFRTSGWSWEKIQAHSNLHPDFLTTLCQDYENILLDINFDATVVKAAIQHIQPAGINLAGGTELQVGMRVFDDIDPIIEALEID